MDGWKVHHVGDQDSHDLEKCVSLLQQLPPTPGQEAHHVSILGGLGGRFDHEMANVNTLFKFAPSNVKGNGKGDGNGQESGPREGASRGEGVGGSADKSATALELLLCGDKSVVKLLEIG